MAGLEQLTREQLLIIVTEQTTVIEQLTAQVQTLTNQVAELTRLLGAELG